MAKITMDEVEDSPRTDRARAEAKAHASLTQDGRRRGHYKVGKDTAIIFRTTKEKKAQILRLADRLDLRSNRKASITETIEMAIDALEEKLGIPKQ